MRVGLQDRLSRGTGESSKLHDEPLMGGRWIIPLWDSVMAKVPGENFADSGNRLQRELTLDEIARRTPENEAALLERKIAFVVHSRFWGRLSGFGTRFLHDAI